MIWIQSRMPMHKVWLLVSFCFLPAHNCYSAMPQNSIDSSSSAKSIKDTGRTGTSKQESPNHLIKQYLKQAEAGHRKAQYRLGMMYLRGEGVERNHELGMRWLHTAAKRGDSEAQYQLGIIYRDGSGVNKNEDEAMKWLQKSADWGDKAAIRDLNALIAKQNAKELKSLLAAAKQDSLSAMTLLAKKYEEGIGVVKDSEHAAYWYRQAAQRQHAESQYQLGVMYKRGVGVPQDLEKAEFWLTQAAKKGLVKARVVLRDIHRDQLRSQGGKKPVFNFLSDTPFRLAAEQGDSKAQYNLGVMYLNGEDVLDKDPVEGVKWLKKSAHQNNVDAQIKLGELYIKGKDVKRDYSEAAKWYEMAAQQGSPEAQYILGNMYKTGLGVPIDHDKAKMWFQKAAQQGYLKAEDQLRH